MAYSELGNNSNGRAVQRSTDAGVHFTDMTNDTQSPPYGMHPDQHAAVFAPGHPTSGSSDRTAAWYAPAEPSPIIQPTAPRAGWRARIWPIARRGSKRFRGRSLR